MIDMSRLHNDLWHGRTGHTRVAVGLGSAVVFHSVSVACTVEKSYSQLPRKLTTFTIMSTGDDNDGTDITSVSKHLTVRTGDR